MSASPPTRVTLAHVAAHAGVDRSVVSKVLNNDASLHIRAETRERVLAAVARLDYRPNALARSLSTAVTGMYGFIIPDFTNPIFSTVIMGAERAAARRGSLLLTGSLLSDESSGEYLDLLGRGRVDGLLIAGGAVGPEVTGRLHGLGVPWVMLNGRAPGTARHILLDDAGATRLAVEHLVALGHKRIGHLAGPAQADTAKRRTAGYRAAMLAAGLPVRRGWVVEADYTHRGGKVGLERLVGARPSVTAVVVANVASAIGAVRCALALGVRVPEQLSLIAVHDLELAAYLQPPLTTVAMPLRELGERGIEALATAPADAALDEVLEGPMSLVRRDSTAPPG